MLFSGRVIQAASVAAEQGELVTRWQYDEPTGATVIQRVQDVEPILEANKAMFSEGDGYSPSRDIKRVASIPMIVIEQWMKEGINIFDKNCREAVKRKLNDPANLFLRTAPGRV